MNRSADRIAVALGIDPDSRQVNVEKLYLSTEKTPGAYWLQLFIATGIAQFGLVLNSTAVIIGAMLVSPLMTPIVQVGMGFAIGHLHLTTRATLRLITSIIFVVLAAALLTQLMPLTEPTAEILARTHPTFLDMIVALFCGLAASFTHARGSRDVVTAAAGTAIAIALVPPVCVIGFGVGTGDVDIALGATMLFTANLAAIILVSDVFFLITGFGRLDFERLDSRVYNDADKLSRTYRLAQTIWPPSNRHMPLRLLLPLGFVLSVSVPLYRALSQVVVQVRLKEAVTEVLDRFAEAHQVLARRVDVTEAEQAVWITIVGDPSTQAKVQAQLASDLDARVGNVVRTRVDIVPSSASIERIFAVRKSKASAPLCPPQPDLDVIRADALAAVSPNEQAGQLTKNIDDVLAWAAPTLADGHWLGWSLDISDKSRELVLDMLGPTPPPAETLTLLREVVRRETGLKIDDVRVRRVPTVLFETPAPDQANVALLVAGFAERIARVAARHGLTLRLTHPDPATLAEADRAAAIALTEALLAAVPTSLRSWMQTSIGAGWRVVAEPPIGRARLGSEAAPVRP
ncbi:MAG: putative hydrophobic protein (TIGR00271 family) [Bradymonadia bacterium]|jgi:uncharacterized hydrophobic protein (TIGR00271 family)